MVTIAEQPCYTLINTFDDSSEVPNEQQLKHDLGELRVLLRSYDCVRLCTDSTRYAPHQLCIHIIIRPLT